MFFEIFGKDPIDNRLKKIQKSENYDCSIKKFKNKREEEILIQNKSISLFSILKKLITNRTNRSPGKNFSVKNQIDEFKSSKENLSYIWLGHSTVLLKISDKTILFDPVFKNAAPFWFIKKRFQPSPISIDELPKIDFVLISHDHYDHLEMFSIKKLKKKYNPKFIVPLGIGEHLHLWGVEEKNIMELDWWNSTSFENIKITCTPAMHSSGRRYFMQNKTLWCSWVIESNLGNKIFFSGDSGYDDHFKKIGDKYGPFDIVFVECGQYNAMWSLSHMHPTQSILAYEDLKGKKMQPIHWGAFDLAIHAWNEPINIAYKISKEKNISLLHPMQGELVEIEKYINNDVWW